jgi:hypothetical protein
MANASILPGSPKANASGFRSSIPGNHRVIWPLPNVQVHVGTAGFKPLGIALPWHSRSTFVHLTSFRLPAILRREVTDIGSAGGGAITGPTTGQLWPL